MKTIATAVDVLIFLFFFLTVGIADDVEYEIKAVNFLLCLVLALNIVGIWW